MEPIRVGVVGGGQLGRMMAAAAHRLNIHLTVLDAQTNSPAGQVAHCQIEGNIRSAEAVVELARQCSVLTVEIEHVNVDALEHVQNTMGVQVHPSPSAIRIIQDKYAQKVFMKSHDVPLGAFVETPSKEALLQAGQDFGYPLMLKSKRLAYDGRGNAVVRSEADVDTAVASLGGDWTNLYAEQWVEYTRELSVLVARSRTGNTQVYPVVETVQQASICHTVIMPAQVSGDVLRHAQTVAERAVSAYDGAGIFAVELFLLADKRVLYNETAPRPHNSGHVTIEACHTDQFEQHLRCVAGLPFGAPGMRCPVAAMVNLLGSGSTDEDLAKTVAQCATALSTPRCTLHWYGKSGIRKGRKVGHMTVTGDCMADLRDPLASLASPYLALADKSAPLVGVIMGSDSDLPTMQACAVTLSEFEVPFELTIVSAHRTPDRMAQYARSAHERGLRVIIAAAGGAAHLPGMVAAQTPLPVIGVPVPLKYLDGQDSLYSIVQMPRGVPCATVAIGNSINAALLAIRMLGAHVPFYLDRMLDYQRRIEQQVLDKAAKIEKDGWANYTP